MQKEIHPAYFPAATVTCACGAKYLVGSTKEKLSVEICSACHPFYTGADKLMDTAGRVERFKTRRSKAATTPRQAKSVRKTTKRAKASTEA